MEPAHRVWAGIATAGLTANVLLHRQDRRLLCQVARNPIGLAVYVAFGLHLFVPRADLVHLTATLIHRRTP